jgi:hypothetical protein
MTLQNEKFEELVSRQLTAELEPQRGKALAAFRAHIAAEGAGPAPIPISRGRSGKSLALWAGVPSLIAACVAVAVTLHVVKPDQPAAIDTGAKSLAATAPAIPASTPPNVLPPNSGTIVFDGFVTHDTPGKIVMGQNNVPLREVRHQEIRQRQVFDPRDNSTTIITEPVEKVGYVEVQPY